MVQPEIADSETDKDILISQQFICKKWFLKYRISQCEFWTNYSKAQIRKWRRGTVFFDKFSWWFSYALNFVNQPIPNCFYYWSKTIFLNHDYISSYLKHIVLYNLATLTTYRGVIRTVAIVVVFIIAFSNIFREMATW